MALGEQPIKSFCLSVAEWYAEVEKRKWLLKTLAKLVCKSRSMFFVVPKRFCLKRWTIKSSAGCFSSSSLHNFVGRSYDIAFRILPGSKTHFSCLQVKHRGLRLEEGHHRLYTCAHGLPTALGPLDANKKHKHRTCIQWLLSSKGSMNHHSPLEASSFAKRQ